MPFAKKEKNTEDYKLGPDFILEHDTDINNRTRVFDNNKQ